VEFARANQRIQLVAASLVSFAAKPHLIVGLGHGQTRARVGAKRKTPIEVTPKI
jgi:hypothetical protein